MKNAASDQIAKNPTQFNIAAIAELEEEALDRRSRTERDSDVIVKFIGSVKFLVLHVILVAAWSTVNLGLIPSVKAFDPLPFDILALFVASESVFLTIFVLISQNRMARQAERRSHLDLQVGMLALARAHHDAPDAAKALPTRRPRCEIRVPAGSRIQRNHRRPQTRQRTRRKTPRAVALQNQR